MEIFLDCLPCMLRQTLEASRMATDQLHLQEKIMEDSIKILSHHKEYKCSPDLCKAMHQAVKKHACVEDPYAQIKNRDIGTAKRAYPMLERFLKKKQNSLYWALKIAATGNIIDSAINNNVNMEDCIEKELEAEFSICDLESFEDKLKTAKKLLIIGDNAGETVFDRVLMGRLSQFDITYAVRSGPIINDATIEDAYASGLADFAKIVSTGCNAPGTILDECSTEFLIIFNSADIIISKGQGNFEALSDNGRQIFFLLKAKCPVISQKLGVDLNQYVFKYNGSMIDQTREMELI
nr:ARMT1-like domain-containing protein [uncultured Caproiciproducens sp.]